MKKNTRLISGALCLVMVLAVVLSAAFIVAHADHACVGSGCDICQQLQLCRQVLKRTLFHTAASFGAASAEVFCALACVHFQRHQIGKTLVDMRVKLSC